MRNDLDRPLGLDDDDRRPARRSTPRVSSGHVAGIGTALLLVIVVGYAALYGSPDGGRSRSIGRIVEAPPVERSAPKAIARTETTGSIPTRDTGPISTAAEVEGTSGVRVTRGGNAAVPGALIIRVDDAAARLPPAPDPRLSEKTKIGILPKIGTDGSRPSQTYARPFRVEPGKAGLPKIALMLGGLGLSATTTRDAIDRLPAAVTFAFAPYGGDLEGDAARARERGHETVLQLPMEPIDSARNDPGPHTLQLAASASETDADLKWQLSRFPGYFAVSPFLGGRFLQSSDALSPVLRELAERGLALVEDGTPTRSALADGARDAGLGAVRATVRLDAEGDGKFDSALSRLEAAARKDGFALGTANALPATIEKLAKFVAGLESRGILLVPASAGLVNAGAVAQGSDARR